VKTALTAKELGLGLTVAPVGVAAPVASLAGMPGVYGDDPATESLSFILKEALELSKAPRVQPPFSFPARGFAPSSDVGEVFHNDSGPWLNAFEDRSRKNVIAIPSEALFTPSEASKVPFGRLSAFGLQRTSEAKGALDHFFHVPIAVKTVVRSNGWPGNTEVNTNSLPPRDKLNVRNIDHNMQKEPALAVDEVSRGSRTTDCILSIFIEFERYLHPTTCCRHADNTLIPVQLEGVQIITRRTGCRLRTRYQPSPFYQGIRRLQRLGCFPYCLYVQIRDKGRKISLAGAVSKSMQVVGISIPLLPANATDAIKRLGKLLDRLAQSICLFWRRQKSNSDSSIHKYIIPHPEKILQLSYKRRSRRIPLSPEDDSPLRLRLWLRFL